MKRSILAYGLAVALTLTLLSVMRALPATFAQDALWLLPILASTAIGGLGPGLFATVLVTLLANDVLSWPADESAIVPHSAWVPWWLLPVNGILITLLSHVRWQTGAAAEALPVPLPSGELRSTAATDELMRAAFEQSALGIALIGVDGRCLKVNPRWCELLGDRFHPGERCDFRQYVEARQWRRLVRRLRRLGQVRGSAFRVELRYRGREGQWRWASLVVSLVTENTSASAYFLLTLEDIESHSTANGEWQRRADSLKKLTKILERTATVRDLKALKGVIEQGARELLAADGLALFLLEGKEMRLFAQAVDRPLHPATVIPLDEALCQRVMRTAEPLAIEDMTQTDPHCGTLYRDSAIRSLRLMPIGHERVTGVLGCYWGAEHAASLEEQDMQAAVADALAAAMANIDLYEEFRFARKVAEWAAIDAKATADALREAQKLAGLGHWHWDLQTQHHDWSEELYRLFGRDTKLPALTYQELSEHLTAASWQALSTAIGQALDSGETYACDIEIVTAGQSRWAVVHGRVVRNEAGDCLALNTTLQDVSERRLDQLQWQSSQNAALEREKQAQLAALNLMEDALAARARAEEINSALRQSEKRLLLAQEGAHVGIWEWDLVSGSLYWSPEYERLYGVEPAGVRTQADWRSRILPADLPLIDEQWEQRILKGLPFEVEFRIRRGDGEIRWMVSKGSTLCDAQGQPLLLSGINIDITERKLAEAQLSKLAQTVEQSPHSIMVTDLQGKIEYVNQAFTQSTGYQLDEVLGRNPRLLKSGKTSPSVYRRLWEVLLAGHSWRGEFINRRKDGSHYIDLAIVIPITGRDGQVTHYASIQEDITEKKRLGEELDQHRHHLEVMVEERTAELVEARASADAANQAKSLFLANMSHEIRTPMNAIIGLTYLLSKDDLSMSQRERLTKIDAAAQHLLSIINDILDLSKIESGRLQLEETDFALGALLDHIRSMVAEQAIQKGLRIELESGDVPLNLRGDPTRLRQALLNFISNAVKFTESGYVRLKAELLVQTADDCLIRFEVSDTGIGIAADQLPALFRAFSQADASMTRHYGGTGLGLAITKRLAEMMGGEVGVRSQLGQGSCFWLTARFRHAVDVVTGASTPRQFNHLTDQWLREQHADKRILLVEDNPVNREVTMELLRAVGLAADAAENGRLALECVARQHYDLILMDVEMPEMDGLSATRWLRAHEQTATVPILAMTANAFDDDRQACLTAGMNDFVAKPVVPEDLYGKLHAWLSGAGGDAPTQLYTGKGGFSTRQALSVSPQHQVLVDYLLAQGLEMSTALTVTRGDVAKYLRLLLMFARTHEGDLQQVMARLETGDWLSAKRLTHGLKGVVGVLGARSLVEAVGHLHKALCSNAELAECQRLAQCCQAEMEKMLTLIRNLPANADSLASDQGHDPVRLEALLDELAAMLAENNVRASQLVRESSNPLMVMLGDAYADFARQIEVYDYEQALDTLSQARQQVARDAGDLA